MNLGGTIQRMHLVCSNPSSAAWQPLWCELVLENCVELAIAKGNLTHVSLAQLRATHSNSWQRAQ